MTKKQKPNPEILSIVNPAQEAELRRAYAQYRKFHGTEPTTLTPRGRKGARQRKILIVLGRVVDIIYEPRTGQRKRIHWVHSFGRDARLATDASGKHLYIVGKQGQVQVDFSRGIVS